MCACMRVWGVCACMRVCLRACVHMHVFIVSEGEVFGGI